MELGTRVMAQMPRESEVVVFFDPSASVIVTVRLARTRPSGEVRPSMAKRELLGLKRMSSVALPSRSTYCVAIWPFFASWAIRAGAARKGLVI